MTPDNHSIQSLPDHYQLFLTYYRDTAGRQFARDRYYAITRASLSLAGPYWYLYTLIATLADFRTRIADLAWRSRTLHRWRCKRQINRILSGLLSAGYISWHGRRQYSIVGRVERREAARLRPINAFVLTAGNRGKNGLYARFLVSLAWTRLPWSRWTWQKVQKTLKIDNGAAQQLFKAFQEIRETTTRRKLRKAVFWSLVPRWYLYRIHHGPVIYDPRPAARGKIGPRAESRELPVSHGDPGPAKIADICRSGNVPAHQGSGSLLWLACDRLTSTAQGRNGGGSPARIRGSWPAQTTHRTRNQARRHFDRDLADRAARLYRNRARSAAGAPAAHMEVRNLDPAGSDRNANRTAYSVNPRASGSPSHDDPPAGSLFEQLIAGLPAGVRSRFERDRATQIIRHQARTKDGYEG